jgi:uncharacterized repeat protein (TIGR01451 family)
MGVRWLRGCSWFVCVGVWPVMALVAYRVFGPAGLAVALYGSLACPASAGNFSIDWNTLAYPSGVLVPPAPDFVLTDQYGYQVRMALAHPSTNYVAVANPAEDITFLGGVNDIFFANDPPQGSGGFGEDAKVATLNFYLTGTTTPVPVDSLNMLVTDIDPLDNAPATDRCDFVTVTGNSGNPTLAYVNGAPTGNGTNASFIIGPSTGPGASGTVANYRTIFAATGGGTAKSNLNFAANQAHCLYYTNTTSTASSNDNLGSMTATFPNGTSSVSIIFDEVIENALGAATPVNQNPAGRGIGVWGAGSFSIASAISLDKQTTATGFNVAGDVISYSFVVTNVGPMPMNAGQNIQITDSKIGLINCPAIPAGGIVVGGTQTCTANYTVTAADVTANQVSNTAVAGVGSLTQSFATRLQSNSDTVVVPRNQPKLTLTKVPNTAGPVNSGNIIGYTYRVTNTGNVVINNVTISDVHLGYGIDPVPGSESLFSDAAPLGNSTDTVTNGSWNVLAPGDAVQFTSSYTVVQADIDNLQ